MYLARCGSATESNCLASDSRQSSQFLTGAGEEAGSAIEAHVPAGVQRPAVLVRLAQLPILVGATALTQPQRMVHPY